VSFAACDENVSPISDTFLPKDYRMTYSEVRDCRRSVDHDLANIIVRTSQIASAAYRGGPYPFPVGSIVVKEEYADPDCRGLLGWTLMRKETAGYDPAFGDWRWQKLDRERRVVMDGKVERCRGCHAMPMCKLRDFTCTEP